MKDRELITFQEKCAHVEMEKEQLEDKLKRIKAAESWEKMSPRSSITGEPFSPYVSETANVVCKWPSASTDASRCMKTYLTINAYLIPTCITCNCC